MSELSALAYKLSKLKDDLKKYEKEIDRLNGEIPDIINQLKEDGSGVDLANILDMSGKGVSPRTSKPGEIIDYSVTMEDLNYKETITIGDKEVIVYTSSKTDALYVISNGLTKSGRKELLSEMKNHLQDDQMAIVTFNGDCYRYDLGRNNKDSSVSTKSNCTNDYSLIGKTTEGKMYCFQTIEKNKDKNINGSGVIVDDGYIPPVKGGTGNSTLMATVNGMVIANNMRLTMETDTTLDMYAVVKENTEGGQRVTAFKRLVFSSGTKDSTDNQYGTINMTGDFEKYAYNGPKEYDDTKVYDDPGHGDSKVDKKYLERFVTVGDGPSSGSDYTKGKHSVGHVDSTAIPLRVQSGSKAGDQTIQGTVCYFYEGERSKFNKNTHGSKDMFAFSQHVVEDWSNPNIFY